MASGPIQYLGESAEQRTPASEYGGADGLIQPDPHTLTPSEANAAIIRAGMADGLDAFGEVVVDPASGRVVPDDLNRRG
ncbi:hypothetical protein [Nocardioides sp.]|uniref:hypothetical protein n=1 Tax=Nocardioides sp. TaxID=35761 RepID=UPI00378441A5